MADWDHLWRELATWEQRGRSVTFWWRDDDATHATPELDRLLAIGDRTNAPVALAVIPRDADASLDAAVASRPKVSVLQHGWSHENHAPDDARQEEHGRHRPRETMLAEIAEGWTRISRFENGLPAYVAAWNRMDEDLVVDLPRAGLAAISTLGARPTAEPAPGVRRTNVHVDIVDWHGSRGFLGDGAVLDQVLDHLRGRRHGEYDVDEPTGLMTHHLFHDEGCWDFIERFLGATSAHPAVRWLDGREAFWP